MTTADTFPTTRTRRRRPLTALSVAEFRQFIRNKTLVVMGIVFPIGVPLATFFLTRGQSGTTPQLTFTTLETFALVALLFVQYYSVLSMITTRRGEGVLKRLRTGEAADWQIMAAPAVPGAILTAIGTLIVAAVIYGAGAPAPVNPVLVVVALIAGVALFSLLALATSAVTRNAEAAQITSLPVMVVAMVGLASIRGVLPERFGEIAAWTPFAAISDLISLGTVGRGATVSESVPAADFAGTFGDIGQPLATLVAWTVLALALTARSFRWDDRG
ncbi:ABC transporter permease [Gordonia terrae]